MHSHHAGPHPHRFLPILLAALFSALGSAAVADPNIYISGLTEVETHSGTTGFDFTITLSAPSTQTVSVDWATVDGSAVAPDDYIAGSGTVEFPPDSTSQIVTISVVGETLFESDEYFQVVLSNPVGGVITSGSAFGWIDNDDVGISIANLTQAEGNTGTTTFTFTLTKSDIYVMPVSVDWGTRDGSAETPDDYVAASGTVVFEPSETVKTVEVDVVADRVYEGNEYFYVDLSNPVNCGITHTPAFNWIQDDDVRVSIADVTLDEGHAGTTDFSFALTLSASYPFEIRVDWTTSNGSAAAPGDYATDSGTVVFPPDSTGPQVVTIAVVGDTEYESREYFFVTLSNPVNGSIHDGSAYGWIDNDDVRILIADVNQPEGNSGTTDFVFNLTLPGPYPLEVSVDWATEDHSAITPEDYLAASGTVVFPVDATSQTVTVQVVGDLIKEGTDLFYLNLTNAVNASIGDNRGIGFINNDDSYPEVSIDDASHFEGNSGTGDFDLAVTLSTPYAEEVRVYYTTTDGTAQAPDDYTNTTDSVIFAPGVIEGVATVPVVGNHEVEDDETFEVTLLTPTRATIGDGVATATILNDDLAGDLFIDDVSLSEGDAGMTEFLFTISLAESNPATIQVDYATSDGTAVADLDYVPSSGTVVFTSGETEQPVAVQVIGDTLDECLEDFQVVLSNPVNATIGDGLGTGGILTDDLLACPDADADCFHDSACGGRDCDDAVPETHPGAPEVNDTLDNQCPGDHGYGVVDEISGLCGFPNPADVTEFSWPVQPLAGSYDLARSTAAGFSTDCILFPATTNNFALDPEVPASGQALFYLVRPLAPYMGSWGQDSAGLERIFSCP